MKYLFTIALLASQAFAAGRYLESWEIPSPYEQAYDKSVTNLKESFDNICGDTFCEGDFGNLTVLDLACSFEEDTLNLKECVWVIAGSYSELDEKTGKYKVRTSMNECHVPMNDMAVNDFNKAYSGEWKTADRAFHEMNLPKGKSMYEAISECM